MSADLEDDLLEGEEYEEAVLDSLERIKALSERTATACERMAEALEAVAEQLSNLTA